MIARYRGASAHRPVAVDTLSDADPIECEQAAVIERGDRHPIHAGDNLIGGISRERIIFAVNASAIERSKLGIGARGDAYVAAGLALAPISWLARSSSARTNAEWSHALPPCAAQALNNCCAVAVLGSDIPI